MVFITICCFHFPWNIRRWCFFIYFRSSEAMHFKSECLSRFFEPFSTFLHLDCSVTFERFPHSLCVCVSVNCSEQFNYQIRFNEAHSFICAIRKVKCERENWQISEAWGSYDWNMMMTAARENGSDEEIDWISKSSETFSLRIQIEIDRWLQ